MFNKRVMNGGQQLSIENDAAVDGEAPKEYEKPTLIAYGDVRDVTLGPTIGEGESGNAVIFRVPPP